MKLITRKTLLTAVVAGLMTAGFSAQAGDPPKSDGEKTVECQGGNACTGKGECGGPGYSCAGNNKCCGKGFVNVSTKAECDALAAKVKTDCKKKSPKEKRV